MSSARALVSIGTNSTRLLIVNGEQKLAEASQPTRLGTGIAESGHLDPAAIDRTLRAIAGYMGQVRRFGASVDCIATSVMRRATDGVQFGVRVASLVGVEPCVLSGDEEAAYSFLGATRRFGARALIGVLDVGGGSSELAVDAPERARRDQRVARTISVEVGAVRLSERHPALLGASVLEPAERATLIADARADAASVLAPLAAFAGLGELIAVGGTAFTAAGMVGQTERPDAVTIRAADRVALIDALLSRDLEARKQLPWIRPTRADILPAGLIVIDEAARILGVDAVRNSVDDLLAGYLYSPAYRQRS
jgi:exopolyphosphatase/guanosine-5'-triphosphate,3'-diphosphate pyrophosphatase